MVKVAPSILAADLANLGNDIQLVEYAGADYIHIDVMDGLFVPNISFGVPILRAARRITSLPLDVHMMIVQPIRFVDKFCKEGADILTIHVEADTEENIIAALKRTRENGVRPAVSLKPGTPAEAVLPFLPYCDMILVMTVEPGFGGQKFMADQMPKVKAIRSWIDELNPSCELEVDGGINGENAHICIENGANVLVAGTSIGRSGNIPFFIKTLKES